MLIRNHVSWPIRTIVESKWMNAAYRCTRYKSSYVRASSAISMIFLSFSHFFNNRKWKIGKNERGVRCERKRNRELNRNEMTISYCATGTTKINCAYKSNFQTSFFSVFFKIHYSRYEHRTIAFYHSWAKLVLINRSTTRLSLLPHSFSFTQRKKKDWILLNKNVWFSTKSLSLWTL